MKTKQTIAVIGATGIMGTAISKSLSKGNYRLLLCADQPEVESLARQIKSDSIGTDLEVVECSAQASWEADIIILTVPTDAERLIANEIKEVANQKIVISVADPYNRQVHSLRQTTSSSAAEDLQKLLPNSKVVKTFRTTFAADFSKPQINGHDVDSFIAGDDKDALDAVIELINTVGFNPVVAGGLSVCHTLESMELYNYPTRFKIQQDLLGSLQTAN